MLAEVVADAAARFDARPAVVDPDGWALTYADLDRLSDEAAAGLARRGVGPGDVVVLSLPNGADYVLAYLAAVKLGAVTAGLNPRLAPGERRTLVDLAQPVLVLADPELAEGIPEGPAPVVPVETATGPEGVLAGVRVPGAHAPAMPPANPDRPVTIVFTSGTTGMPKGATFTGRQLGAIEAMDTGGRTDGGAAMLVSTPLPHVGFMTKLPWYLRTGATLHVLRRWRPADALRLVSEQRMPVLGAVPPQLALMLALPDFEAYDLSALQAVIAGAAPSPPALIREVRERFGVAYSTRYSSTESGGLGTLTAFDAPDAEALHTVGRPRPGTELALRDEHGAPAAGSEVGEIWLRSGAVMAGYWRDEEATAEVLLDGWLRTGDLGRLDEQGCLRIVGRRKELYIRGGYNVYPLEVEAALSTHPGVASVAVVPRPDDVLGEVGVAVVVPRDPTDPPRLDDLRAHAAEGLAGYKLPDEMRLAHALPLTSVGKLDRTALAARIGRL